MDSKQSGAPDPVRFYPDATGEGSLAKLTFLAILGGPTLLLLAGRAQEWIRELALFLSKIYFSDLYAAAATSFQLRERLWARKAILFVDYEPAYVALAKGTDKNRMVLTQVFTLWSVAARYNVAI